LRKHEEGWGRVRAKGWEKQGEKLSSEKGEWRQK
jgi:hypothetical protein